MLKKSSPFTTFLGFTNDQTDTWSESTLQTLGDYSEFCTVDKLKVANTHESGEIYGYLTHFPNPNPK